MVPQLAVLRVMEMFMFVTRPVLLSILFPFVFHSPLHNSPIASKLPRESTGWSPTKETWEWDP